MDNSANLELSFGRPHLLVLGAGASRAAFPQGDRHGSPLPLMMDLLDILDLRPVLRRHGVAPAASDFETLYSALSDEGGHRDLLAELERRVYDYFSCLGLPDRPTLYDHLVLSLRPKDCIATFNWDPLLWQAADRIANLFGFPVGPQMLFLHGNVTVGYCIEHQPWTYGDATGRCHRCGRRRQPSRLLFPVANKNYTTEPSLRKSWEAVEAYLGSAFLLTIFGYRAPVTDAEAVRIMSRAWGSPSDRNLEQVELVDIRSEDELLRDWEGFIHTHHYRCMTDFYRSYLAAHPRRSCEAFWEESQEIRRQMRQPVPWGGDWKTLCDYFAPLIEQDQSGTR